MATLTKNKGVPASWPLRFVLGRGELPVTDTDAARHGTVALTRASAAANTWRCLALRHRRDRDRSSPGLGVEVRKIRVLDRGAAAAYVSACVRLDGDAVVRLIRYVGYT